MSALGCGPTATAAFDRAAAMARLPRLAFDVVVVGGGITGCGVALDAAARGLSTALLEADDFAAGTSSRSSKLVHGGLRYLQHREFGLVYEALAERQLLLRNAPHLVHPLPFLIPIFARDGAAAKRVTSAYSTALWLYDLTGGVRIGHRHDRVSPAELVAHLPSLRRDRLVSGFVYWDAQTDDARLTLAVARTAAAHGAVVVNRAKVVAVLTGPGGRVGGVRLADGTAVRGSVVVNAGGVWSEQIGDLAGASPVRLRPAKGVHLTVPAARLPCDRAVVLPVPGERATLFVVPWDATGARADHPDGRYTYIGTTDTDYDGPLDEPICTAADVERLLSTVNAWTSAGLTLEDVAGSWAGLRPLVAGAGDERTADLSRRHRVVASPAGLVTVTGGKLTTYRKMAADTVDEVERLLAGEAGRPRSRRLEAGRWRRSPTRHLRLVGAEGWRRVPRRGGVLGVPSVRSHLVGRYGAEATQLAALADADADLARPLVPGLPYLRAEAVWAVRQEMAGSLLDVLTRRTRALVLDRSATVAAAPAVARLVGAEAGWSAGRIEAETASLIEAAAAAERALAPQPPATTERGPAGVEPGAAR